MNTSERKQTLVARACSYELAQAIADEIDRLRAENARQRAWIDGVMAQERKSAQFQDADGKWWNCMDERHRKDTEECGSFPMRDLITSPAPFEDK